MKKPSRREIFQTVAAAIGAAPSLLKAARKKDIPIGEQ